MAKHALVVGINDYSLQSQSSAASVGVRWPQLSHCVADADSIYRLLIDSFNFPQENVILLKDAQATRRNILSALTYMFVNAELGDTVFFSYSGHGGLLPATNSPDNTRFYQSIIPYQGDWIYDFRLHQAAHQAGFNPSEVNFTCFLDSCHSGGMHPTVSSDQAIPRSIPFSPEVADLVESMQELWPFGVCLPEGTHELFPNVSDPVIENGVLVDLDEDPNKNFVSSAEAVLIAACKYYEVANEDAPSTPNGHGYLSKALLDLVNSSNFQISYNQLITELGSRVRTYSQGEQNPTLRGQQGRMDNVFLEGWNTSI